MTALLVWCALWLVPSSAGHATKPTAPIRLQRDAESAARAFMRLLAQRAYLRAYACLSQAARRDLDFAEFAERARQVRAFRSDRLRLRESASHLCAFSVEARLVLEVEGRVVLATYVGTMTMARSGDLWRVDSVDLKPSSKRFVSQTFRL